MFPFDAIIIFILFSMLPQHGILIHKMIFSTQKCANTTPNIIAVVVVDVLSECMTSWHENTFRIAGLSEENAQVPGFSPQWTRIRSLDVFFDVSMEKPLKESSFQGFDMARMRRRHNGLASDFHSYKYKQ